MKAKILVVAMLFGVMGAMGQGLTPNAGVGSPERDAVFGGSEKLTFALRHSFWPNLDLVGVVFQTAETVVDGTPAYRVSANAKTLKGLKMLYDLDDTYTTWLEHGSLRPLRFSSRLKEAKYRYKADYVYDWTQGKVQSDYHKLSRPEGKHKVMPLSDGAGDAIAIFYNLRTDDIASFAVNQPRTMTFVMDDTVRMIKYRYAGRERRKIGRMGTFNTLKIVCSLASGADPDGQMFKDGSEFYLWLSDDRNRIPLYIESPIKVGSIVAVLTKYEGLKHPLTSKVK